MEQESCFSHCGGTDSTYQEQSSRRCSAVSVSAVASGGGKFALQDSEPAADTTTLVISSLRNWPPPRAVGEEQLSVRRCNRLGPRFHRIPRRPLTHSFARLTRLDGAPGGLGLPCPRRARCAEGGAGARSGALSAQRLRLGRRAPTPLLGTVASCSAPPAVHTLPTGSDQVACHYDSCERERALLWPREGAPDGVPSSRSRALYVGRPGSGSEKRSPTARR